MAAFTTIDDPSAYFKVQLYTGNGAANHAITFDDTDTDMQPDFVWIKNRDATDSYCLFDAVRGATKVLHCDVVDAEATDADTLDSFASDGFQVDADVKVNTNAEKYVSWNWKAGTTSGINSTGADITPSSYSFNQTAGFSIIKYTGDGTSGSDLAHGLGAVPKTVIVKQTSSTRGWTVYSVGTAGGSSPEDYSFRFNTNAAADNDAGYWNDTALGSVLITLGNSGDVNADGATYIAYCFASKQGYSKFGTYKGNAANAIGSGTFVYTGFRPAMVITKKSDGTGGWYQIDNRRPGYNINFGLFPHVESVEDSSVNGISLYANGFSSNTNDGEYNAAATYIYMAFAEAPFVNSEGVPCNAR